MLAASTSKWPTNSSNPTLCLAWVAYLGAPNLSDPLQALCFARIARLGRIAYFWRIAHLGTANFDVHAALP